MCLSSHAVRVTLTAEYEYAGCRRSGSGLFGRGARSVRLLLGVSKFGVDASGFGELVFEDDDPARRLQRGTAGDEFVGAGGDAELVAGVAAVPAVGALRGEEFRGVETTQERLPDPENVGGLAHAVRRVIFVVEFAGQSTARAVGYFCLNGVSSFVYWTGPRGVKNGEERERAGPRRNGGWVRRGPDGGITYTICTLASCRTRGDVQQPPNRVFRAEYLSNNTLFGLGTALTAVLRAGSSSLPHLLLRSSLRHKRYNTLSRMSTPIAVDIFQ